MDKRRSLDTIDDVTVSDSDLKSFFNLNWKLAQNSRVYYDEPFDYNNPLGKKFEKICDNLQIELTRECPSLDPVDDLTSDLLIDREPFEKIMQPLIDIYKLDISTQKNEISSQIENFKNDFPSYNMDCYLTTELKILFKNQKFLPDRLKSMSANERFNDLAILHCK